MRQGCPAVIVCLASFKLKTKVQRASLSVLCALNFLLLALTLPNLAQAQSNQRTFDQYTWLTSHNAFVNYTDARWTTPNQSFGITGQLERGVRGLQLDTYDFGGSADITCAASFGTDCYDAGVYLCHGGCSGFPGVTYALPRQSFTDVLNEIATWLQNNTDKEDVVTLFLEDYTNFLNLNITIAFSQALPYIYNPAGDDWNVEANGWPTLEWMQQNNKRLIIFTSKSGNENAWVAHDQSFTVENYWSIGAGGTDYECTTRWSGIPLNKTEQNWNRLFVMNHYRDVPNTATVAYDNGIDRLNERWNDYCKPAAGRLPNYVAVDYFELGSAKEFVEQLNSQH